MELVDVFLLLFPLDCVCFWIIKLYLHIIGINTGLDGLIMIRLLCFFKHNNKKDDERAFFDEAVPYMVCLLSIIVLLSFTGANHKLIILAFIYMRLSESYIFTNLFTCNFATKALLFVVYAVYAIFGRVLFLVMLKKIIKQIQ